MPLPSGKAEEVVSITRISLGKSVEVRKAIPAVTVDSLTPNRIAFFPQEKIVRVFCIETGNPIVIEDKEVFDSLYEKFAKDLQAAIAGAL